MENPGADNIGRRKHLGQLALVFQHRHGTWTDFGQFLKHIFSDSPQYGSIGNVSQPVVPACRHNPGGKHNPVLADCKQNPDRYPAFDHERYTRPCISVGAFEEKKNPGLVVADICAKAKTFLLSIGKGDPRQATGRDIDYEPASSSVEDSSAGESQVSDCMSIIDDSNIVGGPRQSVPEESFAGNDLFEDEDVLAALEEILEPLDVAASVRQLHRMSSSSIEAPSGLASEDSLLQLVGRPTTKMRAATLGYLWQFADQPNELRNEFRRLRSNDALQVLHLCGCGICYTIPNTVTRVAGCVERSHLKLGLAEENGRHKTFHMTMAFSQVGDYHDLCGIVHRSTDGDGLF